MAELKTKATGQNYREFLDSISDEEMRKDCYYMVDLMKKITKEEPKMWGNSMVGFGSYHYKYETGREGDWFITGFSPRKNNLTLYLMGGFNGYDDLLSQLGKYKKGQSCLYLKYLKNTNIKILEEMIIRSVAGIKKSYPINK